MSTAGGPKNANGRQILDLNPYEALRLKLCMRNGSRLRQLGLAVPASMLGNKRVTSPDRNKTKHSNDEENDSDYDPDQDDTWEGDLCTANKAKEAFKDLKKTGKETSNKRTVDMAPGGIRTRAKKRVVAYQQTTRETRSKKSLAPRDMPVPTPSVHHASQDEENGGNFDNHLQPSVQDVGVDRQNSNISIANGSDGIANHQVIDSSLPDRQNQVATEQDRSSQTEDNSEEEEPCIRGTNMGKELQRLSRARRGKLSVVITEGRKRPIVPLVAAKFATECNIAVRNHVPVLKNWKEYRKYPGLLKTFMGKLAIKFNIKLDDPPVKKACSEMMKSAVRQQRYKLKKQYFNPYPLHMVTKTSPVKSMTDQQWLDLVEFWKSPKKMEVCEKNKTNRSNVKYHQTTGSRSYEVHLENLGDKYNDQEPDALDLFKECHYSSKKKGYTAAVQSAITQMETKISEPAEDQEARSVIEVVAGVLAENTKKNTFLQNVGIHNNQPTSAGQNLQAELLAEKMENAELRLLVTSQREQMDELSMKLQEAEQARIKDREEAERARNRDREEMAKKQEETDAKLDLVLRRLQRS